VSRPDAKAAALKAEVDGRFRRSVRSREQILEALRELVSEGNLRPTGQQVAERASVSLRTVFRHFDDMEGLYREMQERLEQELRPLVEGLPVEGKFDQRVRALVRRRATLFERAAPFMRSDAIHRWRSLFLADSHKAMIREQRDELSRVLPEVDALPMSRREALELMLSFEAYDRLRTDHRLGRERAQEVVVDAAMALLAPASGRGQRSGG